MFAAPTSRTFSTKVKNYGSTFEYEAQRNKELMMAYREEIARATYIRRDELLKNTVNHPASRFWVSEHRAAIVMASMMRGDQLHYMRPLKREMFQEIYRRFVALKEQNPELSIYALATMAVNQPAPKFYLTPGSAKVIICRIRKHAKK